MPSFSVPNNYILLIIALCLGVGFLLLLFLLFRKRSLPYCSCEYLFTPSEFAFLEVLESAVRGEFSIFAKVRMADILKTQEGLSAKEYHAAFNKIKAKHVDFLICHSEDMSFVCAVELDDASHQREDRIKRDVFVDKAFKAAGVPILHIPLQRDCDVKELRKKIFSCL